MKFLVIFIAFFLAVLAFDSPPEEKGISIELKNSIDNSTCVVTVQYGVLKSVDNDGKSLFSSCFFLFLVFQP